MIKAYRDYLTVSLKHERYTDTSPVYLVEENEKVETEGDFIYWDNMEVIENKILRFFDLPFFIYKTRKNEWVARYSWGSQKIIAREKKNPNFCIFYQIKREEVTDYTIKDILNYKDGELAIKFLAERGAIFSKDLLTK